MRLNGTPQTLLECKRRGFSIKKNVLPLEEKKYVFAKRTSFTQCETLDCMYTCTEETEDVTHIPSRTAGKSGTDIQACYCECL